MNQSQRSPAFSLCNCSSYISSLQLPNYKGFKGTIEQLQTNQYMNSGEVAIIDDTTIEISELPVKTWTQVGTTIIPFCARS